MRKWCEMFCAQAAFYTCVSGGIIFVSDRAPVHAFLLDIPTALLSYFVIRRVATSGRWLASAYALGGASGTVIAIGLFG
jgi:hypothetical protein